MSAYVIVKVTLKPRANKGRGSLLFDLERLTATSTRPEEAAIMDHWCGLMLALVQDIGKAGGMAETLNPEARDLMETTEPQ